MLDKIKSMFGLSKNKEVDTPSIEEQKEYHDEKYIISDNFKKLEDELSKLDYASYLKKGSELTIQGDNLARSILLLDDQSLVKLLYESDFDDLKRLHNIDVYNQYQVVNAFGPHAGYLAYKHVKLDNKKIDYALLDITLGEVVKLPSGNLIELDGIDLAELILSHNSNAKVLFCTAHTLNNTNSIVKKYKEKVKSLLSKDLEELYMNKNGDRVAMLKYILS